MRRNTGRICSGLISLAVILSIPLVFPLPLVLAADYAFTTIDVPGAFGSQALAISNLGNIVGFYDNSAGRHGFLYVGGNFTTIDVPGAYETVPFGINNADNIVGGYPDVTGNHGFLYVTGNFTTIDFPRIQFTYATGINDSANIVGYYCESTGTHGFLDVGGNFTTIDVPGAYATLPLGINNLGNIVGGYDTYDTTLGHHGFLYVGGNFITIDVPGAIGTYAYGINDSSNIVGRYWDFTGEYGFLYVGGNLITIDVPGAYWTAPMGINNTGNIVGFYGDATGIHGFLATPVPSRKMHGLFIGAKLPDLSWRERLIPYRGDEEASNLYGKFGQLDNIGFMRLVTTADGPITPQRIRNAFNEINSQMKPFDVFYLFIAAHGSWLGEGETLDGYVPDETTKTNGDEIILLDYNFKASDDNLKLMLAEIDDDIFKVIMLTSCHSGGFWGNNNPDDIGDLEKLKKIALFAGAEEDADAPSLAGRSIFSRGLEEAFSLQNGRLKADRNEDGFVEFYELDNWLSNYIAMRGLTGMEVFEIGPGDPYVLTEDNWKPISFKSEDFDVALFTKTPSVPNTTDVNIDIKPESYPNSINPMAKGKVPVAILSEYDFDAISVNPQSVTFAGAKPVRWDLDDVNSDGKLDLLLHFNIKDLNLLEEATKGTLTGQTYDNVFIQGTDTVNIVPNKRQMNRLMPPN